MLSVKTAEAHICIRRKLWRGLINCQTSERFYNSFGERSSLFPFHFAWPAWWWRHDVAHPWVVFVFSLFPAVFSHQQQEQEKTFQNVTSRTRSAVMFGLPLFLSSSQIFSLFPAAGEGHVRRIRSIPGKLKKLLKDTGESSEVLILLPS